MRQFWSILPVGWDFDLGLWGFKSFFYLFIYLFLILCLKIGIFNFCEKREEGIDRVAKWEEEEK